MSTIIIKRTDNMEQLRTIVETLAKGEVPASTSDVKVYEKSYTNVDQVHVLMVKAGTEKLILVAGNGQLFDDFKGENVNDAAKAVPLSHENRLVLNRYFDYTVPRAFGTKIATVGLGDRLGLASPGHIETIRKTKAKPVLAQQSIRELTLTNRSMEDMLDAARLGLASPGHIETIRKTKAKPVLAQQSIRELTLTNRSMEDMLDAAAFAVFQEGYTDGYGADGDHIKEESDIKKALSLGISMLTLDCSDQIPKGIDQKSEEEIEAEYHQIPE